MALPCRPNARDCAAQVPFPRHRSSLRDHAQEHPPKEQEHEDADERRTPALNKNPRDDQIRHQAEHDAAGPDVHHHLAPPLPSPPDEPSPQPAGQPDQWQSRPRPVTAVPEQQGQQDEEWKGVGENVREVGVQQRHEQHARQPGQRTRSHTEGLERNRREPAHKHDEKDEQNPGAADSQRPLETIAAGVCHARSRYHGAYVARSRQQRNVSEDTLFSTKSQHAPSPASGVSTVIMRRRGSADEYPNSPAIFLMQPRVLSGILPRSAI